MQGVSNVYRKNLYDRDSFSPGYSVVHSRKIHLDSLCRIVESHFPPCGFGNVLQYLAGDYSCVISMGKSHGPADGSIKSL